MKTNYKPGMIISILLTALVFFSACALAQEDVVISALTDEMQRSISDLKLEDADPPYFMKYLVNQESNCRIRAEYGSITDCDCQDMNQLFLDLRVGDYAFDNSNVLVSYYGSGMNMANLPMEEDYATIRKAAWLLTDQAYKQAVEDLSTKKAILQSLMSEDTVMDLSRADRQTGLGDKVSPQVDTIEWKQRLAKLSAIFKDYPQFQRSSIQLNTKTENRYIINSEGSVVRQGRHVHHLFIDARAQDKNGLPVYQYDRIIVNDINDFPSEKELTAWVLDFIGTAVEMVEAESVDNYIGPVIFTPAAANQMFSQLFLANISNPRKPLTPDNRFDAYIQSPKLVRKVGFRVLPEFLSVIDDPTMVEYEGQKLLGNYNLDDDAVPAQPTNLVEKGKLKNYYMSRTPTKKRENSNGHGRLTEGYFGSTMVVGKPGNVILKSEETYKFEELKEQMLELCRAMDLEYGLIIDRMDFSGMPDPDEMMFYGGGQRPELPRVLTAYKVSVKDGSLTPVRSLDFENVSERALKDILAVGDDFTVSNIMFDRSFNNLASAVIPSILIEEMELTKTSAKSKKPPVALNPFARK